MLRKKEDLGFTEEELYQAMALDIFPLTDFGEGKVGFQGTEASIEAIAATRWGLIPGTLKGMMLNAEKRYASEGKTYLEKLRMILQNLVRVGNDLTAKRIQALLERYPDRPNVFVLTGWEHLPVFEDIAAQDGSKKGYPRPDDPEASDFVEKDPTVKDGGLHQVPIPLLPAIQPSSLEALQTAL